MAENSRQNMFETIVANCLNSAKKDLIKSSMDIWATKDAIDKLKILVPVVSGKYFGKYGEEQKFQILEGFPIISRIA